MMLEGRYRQLKKFPHLIDAEDKILMEQYEKSIEKPIVNTDYAKRLRALDTPVQFNYSSEQLYQLFKIKFLELYGTDIITEFDVRNEPYVATVIHYFTKDKRFFTGTGLRADMSKPSFNKGLLLIGVCGSGKSSTFKVLYEIFQNDPNCKEKRFSFHHVNELVNEYKLLEAKNIQTTKLFYDKINKSKRVCFNDLKTEDIASNYHKVNLLKSTLELRGEDNSMITHATCSYNTPCLCKLTKCICGGPHQPNAENGLLEFHYKYSDKVYDRLASMFNIVEFGRVSFRE